MNCLTLTVAADGANDVNMKLAVESSGVALGEPSLPHCLLLVTSSA